jgi:hypothetical protein
MHESFFSTPGAESILLNQRIEDESTVDAPMDDRRGRQFRLLFFYHQAFTFLTGHGIYLLLQSVAGIATYGKERNIARLIPC